MPGCGVRGQGRGVRGQGQRAREASLWAPTAVGVPHVPHGLWVGMRRAGGSEDSDGNARMAPTVR